MTQYQLALGPTVLQRLSSGDSQLAHLLEVVLNQVFVAQMAEQLRAERYERYERTEECQGYRTATSRVSSPPASADL